MIRLAMFILMLLTLSVSYAQQERKFIRMGNKLMNKAFVDSAQVDSSKIRDAEVAYRKALEIEPYSFDAAYNLGNALYRQQKFEDAVKEYKKLTSRPEAKTEIAKVYHNIGNANLMQGKFDDAIEAYKNALRNNPKDMETKYNLAFAKHLKQTQPQQQQQEQQEQGDGENEEQEQEQQEQQQNQEEKQQEAQEQNISKEDAEKMLRAIEMDDKKIQENMKKEKVKGIKHHIEKDW